MILAKVVKLLFKETHGKDAAKFRKFIYIEAHNHIILCSKQSLPIPETSVNHISLL